MSQMLNQTPAPQPHETPAWLQTLRRVKDAVLNNWPMKLLSLVLAMALWVGLITQDPTLTREKMFRDVSVTVNNADILRRNGYVVVSDLDALLQDVDMTVQVPQQQYGTATSSNYNVRVDLNRLEARAGTQELQIMTTSTSTYGTVTRISPASITVQVEEYVTHSYIPVNVVQEGTVPEGFYAVGITRDPSWITVSGPRSLVEKVDRAQVILNLSELPAREGQVERALTFTLLDAEGNPVESDMLQVTRESVLRERINISLTLYTMRDIDILDAQLYTGQPAEGYEVTDVFVTPGYVTVAGQADVVDAISTIQPSRLLSISGAKETVTGTVDLSKPSNLQWMSTTRANVTVVIQPMRQTVQIAGVPVKVVGVPEGYAAGTALSAATVRITGDEAWVSGLSAALLTLQADVSGLGAGMHEVALSCIPADAEGREYLVEIEPQTVRVILTETAE
ncbi:MAG: hypothetical protein IKK57_09885 [Clostridia bacterium]|nr:hypothetical protein [Clostridia bacterium]